ncbi:alpha/beta hydrolase [Bacillus sp. 31A1R]|uniref:Alpha/beta hydrolase n=1 Tax=Robertmurraya mangrovi TaxID=3098077 RepID=A0ABU5IVR6_9BACI|nr:alpha/beta hydrolase [Bacillus sp. 31A1R]MDZ5471233.1 alpha/beta hydrolase [Bacillus sp. 31A1R]
MKKRILIILTSLIILVLLTLTIAGNYFYNVAINRSKESVELYGGKSSVPANASVDEQREKEEVEKWLGEQTFETLEIESYDGLKLKGVFLNNQQSNGKAVILAHGYRGNGNDMPGITKFYQEQGYDVLRPHARGHGESEGDYIGYGWHERKDYLDWINLLINEYKATDIYLHGFSMGGATVLMTSGENLPKEVKGIINDSGYTSVHEELSHQLKYLYKLPAFPIMEVTSIVTKIRAGYSFGEASAIKQVKKNTLPLFVIHGDQDRLVPLEMGIEIFEAATSEKELWIVPGVGHTEAYTYAKEEYQDRLMEFLNKNLQ